VRSRSDLSITTLQSRNSVPFYTLIRR